MLLIDTYKNVKPSIVAFCAKYSSDPRYANHGTFPHIIGTGFIIDSCGLILTNQHVVDEFEEQISPNADTHSLDRVGVVLFDVRGNEIRYPALEIMGATKISSHIPEDEFFDREPPDIAVVSVKVKNLPSCKIEDNPQVIREGLEVGTAGFPMGSLLLSNTTDGTVKQLSPTLQRGVISAIQPWAVEKPLNFIISVLIQGGASGSPVFDTNTGRVIGVLSARQYEPEWIGLFNEEGKSIVDDKGKKLYTPVLYPTNYSVVVPTYLIADKITTIKQEMIEKIGGDQITLDELYSTRSGVDFIKSKN